MTVIVGLVDNGSVYLAGDRGVSNGESILPMAQPKIFQKSSWVFGYCGNVGVGQIFSSLNFPPITDEDPYEVLRHTIIPDFIEALAKIKEFEDDSDILIGAKGRLFEITTADFGVVELTEVAIGTGYQYALGSLHSTMGDPAGMRVSLAMAAAITHSPQCMGPIDVLVQSD